MKIYKDLISGDELFSDAYECRVVDDVAYEVKGMMISETTKLDDAKFGANPSDESPEEITENPTSIGCNIVLAHRLVETGFTKKDYQIYLKQYLKRITEHLKEENADLPLFKENCETFFKKVLKNFKEYQFFMGESCCCDAGIGLMDFRDDGNTPYLTFLKDGVVEEKY